MFLKAINDPLVETYPDGFALEGRVAAVHLCWFSRNNHDQPTTHHLRASDRYQKMQMSPKRREKATQTARECKRASQMGEDETRQLLK